VRRNGDRTVVNCVCIVVVPALDLVQSTHQQRGGSFHLMFRCLEVYIATIRGSFSADGWFILLRIDLSVEKVRN